MAVTLPQGILIEEGRRTLMLALGGQGVMKCVGNQEIHTHHILPVTDPLHICKAVIPAAHGKGLSHPALFAVLMADGRSCLVLHLPLPVFRAQTFTYAGGIQPVHTGNIHGFKEIHGIPCIVPLPYQLRIAQAQMSRKLHTVIPAPLAVLIKKVLLEEIRQMPPEIVADFPGLLPGSHSQGNQLVADVIAKLFLKSFLINIRPGDCRIVSPHGGIKSRLIRIEKLKSLSELIAPAFQILFCRSFQETADCIRIQNIHVLSQGEIPAPLLQGRFKALHPGECGLHNIAAGAFKIKNYQHVIAFRVLIAELASLGQAGHIRHIRHLNLGQIRIILHDTAHKRPVDSALGKGLADLLILFHADSGDAELFVLILRVQVQHLCSAHAAGPVILVVDNGIHADLLGFLHNAADPVKEFIRHIRDSPAVAGVHHIA